ncbi:MAG: Yip1 family protein [Halobacteriaceae archaeon]
MVRELVTDPQAFFKGKAQNRSVVLEVVIVLAVGGIGIIGSYYFAQRVFDLATTGGYSNFQALGLVIRPLLGIVGLWIGGVFIAHFLAGLFNGRGPIRRLLKLSAWAMVPLAVGNAVRSAAVYLTYNNIQADDVDFGFAGGFNEQAAVLRAEITNTPLMLVAMVVSILSGVAMWYLLSYAVAAAKSIDVSDARKVAAVPAGIYILFLLNETLSSLGVL